MGLFDKLLGNNIEEPVFVKDYDQESNLQLGQLNALLDKVGDDQKAIVEEEIKKIQIGLIGEKNVAYELKNSFLPLVCLHDIRLEYKDYTAQYDFIVLTRKCIFVLETKALTGDIIIENNGNFIRVWHDFKGNVFKKEGMNSPVSQNQKHVDILEHFLKENKMAKNVPIFSLIVISNPKSIIDMKFAKKEIRQIIIKHDQIKSKMNDILNTIPNIVMNDRSMLELANFICENDHHIEYDYVKKLNLKIDEEEKETKEETNQPEDVSEKSLDDRLYEALRAFRIKKGKELNAELYLVFTNAQLSELVLKRPKNEEEFLKIAGFGKKKYEDFGENILEIIRNFDSGQIPEKAKNDQLNTLQGNENEPNEASDISETPLYKELRSYRLKKSQSENIKPYLIFNNQELEELCIAKPTTKEALISIHGFANKYENYGEDILRIIRSSNDGGLPKKERDEISSADKENENGSLSSSGITETALYKELRSYRYNQSLSENIKPYMIFNNQELGLLCTAKPKTKEEFISLHGFRDRKYEKYGTDILNIINKFAQ